MTNRAPVEPVTPAASAAGVLPFAKFSSKARMSPLARRPRSISRINYYLWTDEGPFRILPRLHSDLLAGLVGLPSFANTRRRVLEATIWKTVEGEIVFHVRPTVYAFDQTGRLDIADQAEAAAVAIHGLRGRKISERVHDIRQAIDNKRWVEAHHWKPDQRVLRTIRADIEQAKKLPILRDDQPQQPRRPVRTLAR